MYPTIPEDRSKLTAAELRTLAGQIKSAAREALAAAKGTPELATVFATAQEQLAVMDELNSEAQVIEDTDAFLALEDDVVDEAPIDTDDADEDDDEDDTDGADDETADEAEEEKVEVTAAAQPARKGRVGVPAVPERTSRAASASQFAALGGISGRKAGEMFSSSLDLAEAIITAAEGLRADAGGKHVVGQAKGNFDADHRLGQDPVWNLQRFEDLGTEVTAALCAPAEPQYSIGCANSSRRPVRASLPGFLAPRGRVTVYPSPTLEDITTGTGIWTAADDANLSATKEACARIVCATPVEFTIYGVYRCITISNMLQLTFPELVDAYLNRLAASWARLAEIQLLEAMASSADTVTVTTDGYDGATSILRALLQYRNAYDELQRWDGGALDVWMHRSVLWGMKAGLASRRRTDGGFSLVPTDSQIRSTFADAGFTPHFFMDTPSWSTAQPQFTTSGVLREFPRNVEMLVAPPGKYAVMDRGELNIGVTGNGLYRDNASNTRNEFTFFFENFEGIVDTDSCPSHILELNDVCWNGQQIADVKIDCEGEDQIGAGS